MKRKAKICMIGATAVGKSSLVAQYVTSIFSERYRTTIGVKIETHSVQRGDTTLDLVLWDISGEDEFQNVQASYLVGASGCLVVIDGTRRETIEVAIALEARCRGVLRTAPFLFVVNKSDLVASWEITAADLEQMERRGWPVVMTSAKTGAGVAAAFERLADLILGSEPWR